MVKYYAKIYPLNSIVMAEIAYKEREFELSATRKSFGNWWHQLFSDSPTRAQYIKAELWADEQLRLIEDYAR